MGPTLYNSSPGSRNLVNKMGKACQEFEECYFLHSDMLHEAPHCTGIVHDPETLTGYGTVFWQVDGWNNELVRFDFQKPHGPGSMDHAVAAIRRYPEVKITPNLGKHTGMVIDALTGNLYFSDYEMKKIVVMDTSSGAYARTARIEYPIYSSRLPTFEVSRGGSARKVKQSHLTLLVSSRPSIRSTNALSSGTLRTSIILQALPSTIASCMSLPLALPRSQSSPL